MLEGWYLLSWEPCKIMFIQLQTHFQQWFTHYEAENVKCIVTGWRGTMYQEHCIFAIQFRWHKTNCRQHLIRLTTATQNQGDNWPLKIFALRIEVEGDSGGSCSLVKLVFIHSMTPSATSLLRLGPSRIFRTMGPLFAPIKKYVNALSVKNKQSYGRKPVVKKTYQPLK